MLAIRSFLKPQLGGKSLQLHQLYPYYSLIGCRQIQCLSASNKKGRVVKSQFQHGALFETLVTRRNFSSSTKDDDLKYKLVAGGTVLTIAALLIYQYRKRTSDRTEADTDLKKEVKKPPPPKVDHLPDTIPYLIVGGGTAAFAAFRSIRARDPKAKVVVITDDDYNPYMRPPLSKELWFSEPETAKNLKFLQWNKKERSIFLEHEEFYCSLKELAEKENGGVTIIKSHKVVKIDAGEQKAYLDNGQLIGYEKCLLATGGKPKNIPPFENAAPDVQKRTILYRGIKDFKNLEAIVNKANSLTIVGGGFLGSELACALGHRGKYFKSKLAITQIFPESGNMAKVLPEYLCEWTTQKVKSEGKKHCTKRPQNNSFLN